MKSHDREIAADRQQDNARAVPSEAWVELERARQDLGSQERTRTVADDDNFLGVAGARDVGEVLRKTVDALVPFRPMTVGEYQGPERVRQARDQISQFVREF